MELNAAKKTLLQEKGNRNYSVRGLWWTGAAAKTTQKRLSREKRLERLGITESGFSNYKSLFLNSRIPRGFSERMPDGSWPKNPWKWDDPLILRHLCGEKTLAVQFGDKVDQLVFDIDCKRERGREDAIDTTLDILNKFPGKPLIYQSSDSGGIRILYFLSQSVSRTAAMEKATNMLASAGIAVRAGLCEVRLGKSPDRLPFGQGSMLLDCITLEPIYRLSLSETLKIAVEHRLGFSLDPRELGITGSDKDRTRHSEYSVIIKKCLAKGLTNEHTTTECLQKLAWYGRVELKMSNLELIEWLCNCISEWHNNKSDRVNDGRISVVFSQINRIVTNLRARPSSANVFVQPVGLSEQEVRHLLNFSTSYTVLRGAFIVLCYSKAQILGNSVKKRLGQGGGGTNKWGTVFSSREDIPNGARIFKPNYIELGKKTLRRLEVPWSNNTGRIIGELIQMGILVQKRKPWLDGHKVRQFWVNFPFDWSVGSTQTDFDNALLAVLGSVEIRKRFGSYLATKIANRARTSALKLNTRSKSATVY